MKDYPKEPQVPPEHYRQLKYLGADRWVSYGSQVRVALRIGSERVLEIGIGNGIVRDALRALGVAVTTVDIDPQLRPDIVGSVTALPCQENSFDLVIAAEVLEHIPYEELAGALSEIRRVTRRYAYITLPHAGAVIDMTLKLPLLPRISIFAKIPFFWKRHIFNGEHYWELGKRGFAVSRITQSMRAAGFSVVSSGQDRLDPAHYYFLLQK